MEGMSSPAEQRKNSVSRPQNRHLKPFKPGESGNPKGRPRLTDGLDVEPLNKLEVTRAIVTALAGSPDKVQPVIDRLYERALGGSESAIEFLLAHLFSVDPPRLTRELGEWAIMDAVRQTTARHMTEEQYGRWLADLKMDLVRKR